LMVTAIPVNDRKQRFLPVLQEAVAEAGPLLRERIRPPIANYP
jgi:hypothetical protein